MKSPQLLLALASILFSPALLFGQTSDWVAIVEASVNGFVRDLATDPSDNVIAAGSYFGTADLDPGASVQMATSAGNTDPYVIKLD